MRRQAGGGEDRRRRGDDYEEDYHQGEGQPDQRQNQAQRQAGGGEDHRRRGDDYEEDRHQGEGQPNQRQIQAQRPSSGLQPQPHQLPPLTRNVDYVVKEHLSAAITCLDQELQSLQKELDELETMESASAACQEVITSTEGKPDPLLPITSGPENSSWDRWFQRVRSRSNKWWASKGSDFS